MRSAGEPGDFKPSVSEADKAFNSRAAYTTLGSAGKTSECQGAKVSTQQVKAEAMQILLENGKMLCRLAACCLYWSAQNSLRVMVTA
jgi:hypothetical protein